MTALALSSCPTLGPTISVRITRGVFVANYIDDGGDAGVPLTGTDEVVLVPTS